MSLSDKQLAEALAAKMLVLRKRGDALSAEDQKLRRHLQAVQQELSDLANEYRQLKDLFERYSNGAAPAAPAPSSAPMRPTEYVLLTVAKAPNGMAKRDIINLFAHAIEAGQIATATKDPAKLASSLVGNLIQRGRLLLNDNLVTLPKSANGDTAPGTDGLQ